MPRPGCAPHIRPYGVQDPAKGFHAIDDGTHCIISHLLVIPHLCELFTHILHHSQELRYSCLEMVCSAGIDEVDGVGAIGGTVALMGVLAHAIWGFGQLDFMYTIGRATDLG